METKYKFYVTPTWQNTAKQRPMESVCLRPPSKRSAKKDKLAVRALKQDGVKPTGHLTFALNNAGVRSPL